MLDNVVRHLEALIQSTGSQLRPDPCTCGKATAQGRGTSASMRKCYCNNFSANENSRSEAPLLCYYNYHIKCHSGFKPIMPYILIAIRV